MQIIIMALVNASDSIQGSRHPTCKDTDDILFVTLLSPLVPIKSRTGCIQKVSTQILTNVRLFLPQLWRPSKSHWSCFM